MNLADWQIAIAAVVFALYVWAGVFFFIPWCMTSIFRYRLWAIRDDLFDELIKRRPRDPALHIDLLERMESYIRHAPEVTFAKLLTHGVLLLDEIEDEDARYEDAIKCLVPLERQMLLRYERRFGRAVLDHLFRG